MNKKLISTITLSAILIAPTNILAKTFSDVNNNDWFYSVVNELSDKGIISGYEDNTFKPQKSVSYAEFLTLLNNSIGEKQSPDYKNSEEWYKPTFDYLKNKGVIANIANPNAEITRNEMAKYLSLGLEKLKNQKIDTTTPASIKDFDSLPNEYKDLVASVVNAGLIKGDENQNFNGIKSLTRAETAVIIKGLGGEGKPVEKAKKPDQKPVAQGTFPLPLEGKDKYGNPYKIHQSIVDKYPENRNPNLSGANAQQPIVNPDLLQEYGQKYLDRVNGIITDPNARWYGCYEKWAPELINGNIKNELDGDRLMEEDRKNGLTPLSDLDFSKMSEKELQDYL